MKLNGQPTSDVDETLRGYFQAEMPDPWPDCPTPQPVFRRRQWFLNVRWAVAASVGLLLAAYLALSGFFPRETMGRLLNDPQRNIGLKLGPDTSNK